MCRICCPFSYFYIGLKRGNKKIIMRKRKQRLKTALAIDALVITCHVKIPVDNVILMMTENKS